VALAGYAAAGAGLSPRSCRGDCRHRLPLHRSIAAPAADVYLTQGESFLSRTLPYLLLRWASLFRVVALALILWFPLFRLLPLVAGWRVDRA